MAFDGSGSSTVNSANDVFISGIANGDVLEYNNGTAKWNNQLLSERVQDIVGAAVVAGTNMTVTYNDTAGTVTLDATGGTPTYANLPAGSTVTVSKSGTWPARPTSRTDIVVQWKGPDPSPSIVSSGTGGMMDNVDIRLITP